MKSNSEVEKLFFSDAKSVTPEELDQLIAHYWDQYEQETDIRNKWKLIKKAAFFAYEAAKKGVEDEKNLKQYVKILQTNSSQPNPPFEAGKQLSFVIGSWLKAQGIENIEMITEVKGSVAVEGGTITVSDVGFNKDLVEEGEMVMAMQNGEAVYIGTGGDGGFGIRIRLVNCPEPVLEAKEFKKILAGSKTYLLNVPSGKVKVWANNSVEMDVPSGVYKTAIYLRNEAKFFGYVIVFAPADKFIKNEVGGIETLG